MPLLSVIIPTCHRNQDLTRCLRALVGDQRSLSVRPAAPSLPVTSHPDFYYEVVVTDDGRISTAEVMLQTTFPFVRWVRGPRRGPAANRNYGAIHAKGNWLLFLDDDCIPNPGWLGAYALACSGTNSILEGKTTCIGKKSRADEGCPINETGGLLWSCNFAIRRDVFFEAGGFDELYPAASMEDLDFAVRLRRAGHRIQFVPGALIAHPWKLRHGLEFVRLQAKSILYFVRKHPEAGTMFPRTWGFTRGTRALVKEFPLNLFRFGTKGSFRELGLDLALATTVAWPLMMRNGIRNNKSDIGADDSSATQQSDPALEGRVSESSR
jgi:GT2 family glycosyltransferase